MSTCEGHSDSIAGDDAVRGVSEGAGFSGAAHDRAYGMESDQAGATAPYRADNQAPCRTNNQAPYRTDTQAPCRTDTQAPYRANTQAPYRAQGTVIQLDRGFPLVHLDAGRQVRCKHATALVKGEKIRAVVGDRVAVNVAEDADMAQIAEIMPRKRAFVRRDPAERSLPQVLAANFDTVIVAHPLAELNVRRLERELVLAHETGASVVVALTKADLAEDAVALENAEQVRRIVGESAAVEVVSELDRASVEALRAHVPAGSMAVLIGRSGVGKSSLVNLLAGAPVQQTTPVREVDGKGRHTTVNRAIVPIGGGGFVVDMPGVRGMGLWESEEGIEAAFADVVELAAQCKFRDCTHESEPGCAVRAAVDAGALHPERLDSYRHLVDENQAQRDAAEEAQRIRGRKGHPRRRG